MQPSKVPYDEEMRQSRFHQGVIAEWFGTTVFVLFLVLVRPWQKQGVHAWIEDLPPKSTTLCATQTIMSANGDAVRIGLVAGLTFFALVYMLFSTSGAHLNPAVTVR